MFTSLTLICSLKLILKKAQNLKKKKRLLIKILFYIFPDTSIGDPLRVKSHVVMPPAGLVSPPPSLFSY